VADLGDREPSPIVRVYWFCGVLKESGAETTPFRDPLGEGWEDRLDVSKGSGDLMFADESS
jgi:hypothetical protein